MRRPFTPTEEKFLLDNRLILPSRKLAEELGCSRCKVQNYFRKHNLTLPKEVKERFRVEGMKGRTTLEPWQSEYIKKNYLELPEKTLAKHIGRSGTAVRIRLRQLGLVIPAEIIEKRKKESQFSKGNISHNKGKKQEEFMSPEAIERTKKTRFQKGSIPHNTKYNGYERIGKDGYVEIRVRRGKFMHKHRLVWEKEKGPIPEGHLVCFKDGNRRNFEIDNLELIDMKENMIRNSLQRFPEEVRPSLKLIWEINNELK